MPDAPTDCGLRKIMYGEPVGVNIPQPAARLSLICSAIVLGTVIHPLFPHAQLPHVP